MASPLKYLRDEDGFSIIELLFAGLLLAVGILALGSVTTSTMDRNADSQRTTIAVNLAQEKIEDVKNLALAGPLTDGTTVENNVDGLGVAGTGSYTRTTVITGGGAGSLATVTVTVAWVDKVNESVVLATKIYQ